MNPVGCDETVLLLRCAGCAASYFEVEESGFSHAGGPEYWARGPLHPKLAEMAAGKMERCPAPFQSHQVFCPCLGHGFMANIMYCRLMFPDNEGTPWSTEENLRSRLEWLWTPRLDRALRLAARVHRRQPRDDGLSYLCEHVLPVALEVADYLRAKVPPFEVERAAAVALLHDVLEDREWAEPPMSDEELQLVPDVVPSRRTARPLDLAREIVQAAGVEVLTSVIVLTKTRDELLSPWLSLVGARASHLVLSPINNNGF